MNIFMWIVVGAILGWLAYSALGFNAARGMLASIVIGAVGGMLGGQLLAPFFTGPLAAEGVSLPALSIAALAAAACLLAGNLIYKRWDI